MHLWKGHEKAVVLCYYETMMVTHRLHCHSGVKATNQTFNTGTLLFTLNTISNFWGFFDLAGLFYLTQALKAHIKFRKTTKLSCTYSWNSEGDVCVCVCVWNIKDDIMVWGTRTFSGVSNTSVISSTPTWWNYNNSASFAWYISFP